MSVARWRLGLLALCLVSCRRAGVTDRPAPKVIPAAARPAASNAERVVANPAPSGSVAAAGPISGCVTQEPQAFLIEAHLRSQSLTSGAAQAAWWATLQRSIRYRTEQYGHYKGFGLPTWNPRPLASQMRVTKFMGVPVVLHERVLTALHCVEQAIERDCAATPYRPVALAGTRQTNTYFGGDVTNHVYGIALDIDPSNNPCCNCVEPWRSNPRCRGKKTDIERMAMPRCWVTTFERYGFYWLGHDELKDTMHFEFLGDPAKVKSADHRDP